MTSSRHDGEISSDRWLSDTELAKLASSGAIEGRRRTPPVRGWTRRLLGVIWLAALTLLIWGFISIGPKVPKALDWVSTHLGAAVVNATSTGSPKP